MPPPTTLSARERTEFRRQAGVLADRAWLALAALADAGPGNVVVEQLLAAAPSVQHLSLRNQITLLVQAGERGIALRDIDTDTGWARRGRAPAQPGLRIVRPHDDPARPGRTLFRVSCRWEFSQTEPASGDVAPQAAPAVAGDPAELAGNLIDQLGTHGYRVAPGPAGTVDHPARRITVDERTWHGDPAAAVRVFVPALAHALTAATDPVLARKGDLRAG
ncbi:MAG TPA: hypothetical protein VGL02_06285 [Streptomyces sp.]